MTFQIEYLKHSSTNKQKKKSKKLFENKILTRPSRKLKIIMIHRTSVFFVEFVDIIIDR